jgi:hypothetical protein
MSKLMTFTLIPTMARGAFGHAGEVRAVLRGFQHGGGWRDDGSRCASGRRPRHARGDDRQAYSWGKTKGKIGIRGGKVSRSTGQDFASFDGKEQALPNWEAAVRGGLTQQVGHQPDADRHFDRQVRPFGSAARSRPSGAYGRSADSRRFVALSAQRMKE